MTETRTISFQVLLTPSEYQLLKSKAHAMEVSRGEYLRRLLLAAGTPTPIACHVESKPVTPPVSPPVIVPRSPPVTGNRLAWTGLDPTPKASAQPDYLTKTDWPIIGDE